MKTKSALVLVPLLVVALAAPATAATRRGQSSSGDRIRRGRIAAQIDTLKASDRQLEDAVSALSSRLSAQESEAESAQQASKAADASLAQSEKKLADTDAQVGKLRGQLAARALAIYTRPSESTMLELMQAHDISDAIRRQALLSHVMSSEREIVEKLRVARDDENQIRNQLAKNRDQARQRKKAATDQMRALVAAKGDAVRVRSALDQRIKDFLSEADAIDRDEPGVASLIKAHDNDSPVSGSGLIWPVRGPLTSCFCMRWGRMHTGIDIAPGYGTPIKAAKAGTVIFTGWMGGYGNAVIISHGGALSTLYGHQSRIAATQGQSVSQGQVIGYVGSTGHSTGPHLHFETRVNGTPQNPMKFLP